jgi:hypothetical protein
MDSVMEVICERTTVRLTADVVKGAVAGAAGTWIMTQVTTWMYAGESEAAKQRENAARAGSTAYERAAEQASQAVGTNLSDEQRSQVGTAIHWATGIAAGAAYRWSADGGQAQPQPQDCRSVRDSS